MWFCRVIHEDYAGAVGEILKHIFSYVKLKIQEYDPQGLLNLSLFFDPHARIHDD